METGFCQTNIGGRGIFVTKHLCGPQTGSFRTGGIDLLGPLEGGGNQRDLTVHYAEHATDTGGIAPQFSGNDHSAAHTQGRNEVGMPCQDTYIAPDGADDELFRFTVIDQSGAAMAETI